MERLFTSAKQFCKSDSNETTKSYRIALIQFGQSKFGKDLNEKEQLALTQDDIFPQLDRYIRDATKQDVLDDLRAFKEFLDKLVIEKKIGGMQVRKKYEVATKTLRISIVQAWFEMNEIGLPKAYRSEFTYKEKPEGDDVAFTHETALAVYHQLRTQVSKCLFVFLLSTGCRIREATSVKLGEITWDNYKLPDGSRGPVRIRFDGSYTKNGKPRVVFLTKEAEDLIRELWTEKLHQRILRRGPHQKRQEIWKTGRDLYLLSTAKKRLQNFPHVTKGVEARTPPEQDDRLFPVSTSTIAQVLKEAIQRAGYVEKTKSGNNKLHIHSTRKFFRTQFGQAAGPDAAHTIMGHSPGLTANYRRLEEGQVATLFQRYQGSLKLFRDKEALAVQDRVDRQADQLLALERENAALREESNARMVSVEQDMQKLMRKMETVKFIEEVGET